MIAGKARSSALFSGFFFFPSQPSRAADCEEGKRDGDAGDRSLRQ